MCAILKLRPKQESYLCSKDCNNKRKGLPLTANVCISEVIKVKVGIDVFMRGTRSWSASLVEAAVRSSMDRSRNHGRRDQQGSKHCN